jgi:G:T-mismatch repair DNA endonuclease (very short patch repair protein)
MSNTKLYTRICTQCKLSFQSENRKAKICSEKCRAASYVGRIPRKRVTIVCQRCGISQDVPPSRGDRKYCSRKCQNATLVDRRAKLAKGSTWARCDYCGKAIRKFKSRTKQPHVFCGNDCYHKWDAWHKSQPEQQRKFAARAIKMFSSGTSKVEDMVADWLDRQELAYERQVAVVRFSMDFRVNGAFIEVQGCYWHGCPYCYLMLTPKQQKRVSRDKAKATYCRRRNIPLYYIWEHDIRKGDFSALMPLVDV